MKPAPPEEMLRRQMDKLEEAILSVDAEHAEALTAEALAGEEEVFADAVAPIAEQVEPPPAEDDEPEAYQADGEPPIPDRKSVGEGTGGQVRVDIGGRRIYKKKRKTKIL